MTKANIANLTATIQISEEYRPFTSHQVRHIKGLLYVKSVDMNSGNVVIEFNEHHGSTLEDMTNLLKIKLDQIEYSLLTDLTEA